VGGSLSRIRRNLGRLKRNLNRLRRSLTRLRRRLGTRLERGIRQVEVSEVRFTQEDEPGNAEQGQPILEDALILQFCQQEETALSTDEIGVAEIGEQSTTVVLHERV